jgi:hypothetical protein
MPATTAKIMATGKPMDSSILTSRPFFWFISFLLWLIITDEKFDRR